MLRLPSFSARLALVALLLTMVGSDVSYGAGADAANAAQRRDIGALRGLVQRKADVNAAQPDGTTALHWAVVWNMVYTRRTSLSDWARESRLWWMGRKISEQILRSESSSRSRVGVITPSVEFS